MNYFELYPGDYLRDTARLGLADHGAYLKLMLAYYGEEKPLPADLASLYQIASAVTASDKAAVRKVVDLFFPVAEDGLRHKNRIDEEIAKAQKRIAIAQANGAKNKSKNNPEAHPTDHPDGTQRDTQRVGQRDTQPLTQSGEALHTPHATSTTEASAPAAESVERAPATLLSLPIPADDPDWLAWTGHQQAQRRWSIARQQQALGHLRQVLADDGDPAAVLRWALSRSLADLLDCHRRMRADAAREAASDKRPGESLADASVRRSLDRLDTEKRSGPVSLIDLMPRKQLAHGGAT